MRVLKSSDLINLLYNLYRNAPFFALLFTPLLRTFLISIAVPKIHPFSFGDEPLFEGESASVQCHIFSGDMPLTFSWTLNEEPIRKYPEINTANVGNKISVLSIDSIHKENAGNYTCIASNRAGFSTYTAELTVKGNFKLFMPNFFVLFFHFANLSLVALL